MASAIVSPNTNALGAGYYGRVFMKETKYEFLGRLRLRAFSLSAIGFPVMFYLLFGVSNRHTEYARYLLASYSCFGMVVACLFGIGVGVSHERVQGWLEMKQASPMPRFVYLLAKVISCAAFAVVIVSLLLAIGTTMGGVQVSAGEVVRLYGVTLAGAVPFSAMGLLIALLAAPSAAPGIVNLIYLPMSFASGLWMPIETLPHWLQKLAPALPTYHYAQVALSIFGYARPGSMLVHWEALAGFSCLMLGAAWIIFSRSEANA